MAVLTWQELKNHVNQTIVTNNSHATNSANLNKAFIDLIDTVNGLIYWDVLVDGVDPASFDASDYDDDTVVLVIRSTNEAEWRNGFYVVSGDELQESNRTLFGLDAAVDANDPIALLPVSAQDFEQGAAVSLVIHNVGGTPTTATITPAIPGLTLSIVGDSLYLSGTPTTISTPAVYTFEASNDAGSNSLGVTIGINSTTPPTASATASYDEANNDVEIDFAASTPSSGESLTTVKATGVIADPSQANDARTVVIEANIGGAVTAVTDTGGSPTERLDVGEASLVGNVLQFSPAGNNELFDWSSFSWSVEVVDSGAGYGVDPAGALTRLYEVAHTVPAQAASPYSSLNGDRQPVFHLGDTTRTGTGRKHQPASVGGIRAVTDQIDWDSANFPVDNRFTIYALVKPLATHAGGIVSRYDANSGFYIIFNSNGRFQFAVLDGSGGIVTKDDADTAYVVGQWYRLVMTFDNGTLKIYVNGVEVHSQTGVTYGPLAAAGATYVGRYRFANTGCNADFGDVAYLGRAWTAAEVAAVQAMNYDKTEDAVLATTPTSRLDFSRYVSSNDLDPAQVKCMMGNHDGTPTLASISAYNSAVDGNVPYSVLNMNGYGDEYATTHDSQRMWLINNGVTDSGTGLSTPGSTDANIIPDALLEKGVEYGLKFTTSATTASFGVRVDSSQMNTSGGQSGIYGVTFHTTEADDTVTVASGYITDDGVFHRRFYVPDSNPDSNLGTCVIIRRVLGHADVQEVRDIEIYRVDGLPVKTLRPIPRSGSSNNHIFGAAANNIGPVPRDPVIATKMLTLAVGETINVAHLTGSEVITSKGGTAEFSISTGVITCTTAGTAWEIELNDGSIFPLCEGDGTNVRNVDGSGNHGTITVGSTATAWAGYQTESDRLVLQGYSLDGSAVVPARTNGLLDALGNAIANGPGVLAPSQKLLLDHDEEDSAFATQVLNAVTEHVQGGADQSPRLLVQSTGAIDIVQKTDGSDVDASLFTALAGRTKYS